MTESNKRIAFSIFLIFLAAAVQLWSDRHNRHHGQANAQMNAATAIPIAIAILQHSSNPMMDEIRQGVLDGLHSKGFNDGQNLAITIYNPEGDLPTGNLMAQKITGGDYRLAVSISTVMLQALANANRNGRVGHVFGAVTAPVAAGVGIKSLDSLDKPPYLTGIGTPQPVADIFRLAKQINPALKTVGVVWNPAEVNSEFCTKQARAVALELGLTLLEAPIEQTKDVREAAESLVARGVQAFWTGGDSTVNATVDSLVEVARNARIPVFSNISGHAKRGSLFDLGADYHEVGEQIGRIAGDVLGGANTATLPVRDYVPKRLLLNEQTRSQLRDPWQFSPALYAKASIVIDKNGVETQLKPASSAIPPPTTAAATSAKPLDHLWKIKRMIYVESPPAEETMQGVDAGFKAAGLLAGRDFTLSDVSAQGDMSLLSGLADATGSDGTELLLTLSTPTLQTAIHKLKKIPIVFTLVANPIIAGAGTDDTHHLPNVTGVYTLAPFPEMVALLRHYFPALHRVGTLFTPGEDNSVYNMEVFEKTATEQGLSVVKMPVNSASELPNAALAMASQPIDAWVQILDNQTVAGFTAITQAATRAKKPLFTFTESGVKQGAAVAYSMDYYQAGFDAALKAAEVMRGKPPAEIAFSKPTKISLIVSEAHAAASQLPLPAELVNKADKRLGQ